MEIQKLQISQFGKHFNTSIELSPGINVCYGENETGKSTLFSFIKAMFFGMERGRGRASNFDDFSKYMPFEATGRYGGTIFFSKGEKNYVLERSFGKNVSNPRLFCREDKEEHTLSKEDAELLLGISSEAFENTVFIGQLQAEPSKNLGKVLLNYASNIYSTGSNEFQLNEALSVLEEKLKEIDREQKKEAMKKQEEREKLEQELSYLSRDIHALSQEKEGYKQQENSEKPQNNSLVLSRWMLSFCILLFLGAVASVAFLIKPYNYVVLAVLFLLFIGFIVYQIRGKKKESRKDVGFNQIRILRDQLTEQGREKQVRYDNIMEHLEEFDEPSKKVVELQKKRVAISSAIERIQLVSTDVRQSLRFVLNERVSEILKEITDGKYEEITVTSELQINVISEGRRLSLWQLSKGTIEQCYFALRMAASEILFEESLPYILDDTFVYYDDLRLKNVLKWLYKSEKQIIILSCQMREKRIFSELSIPVNYFEL